MTDRFKRGQVWLNPDDMLMTVVSVRTANNEQKVNYVTEQGELGYFYSSNKSITDNIQPLATESEQLRKGLAELETLLAQANKKIQWYERTEAKND